MFKFIKHWTRPKNVNSKRFKQEMAKHLDKRHIKYVTERKDDVDEIIGREGEILIKGDELIVYASTDIVFRAKIEELTAGELLSLEGAVLTGKDLTHGGEERTVIAYYKYWRK